MIPRSEMVKGYEYAKDQYVVFTDEELKELQEKSTQSIDIAEFVPAEAVPDVYLSKTYWLGPGKGGGAGLPPFVPGDENVRAETQWRNMRPGAKCTW